MKDMFATMRRKLLGEENDLYSVVFVFVFEDNMFLLDLKSDTAFFLFKTFYIIKGFRDLEKSLIQW